MTTPSNTVPMTRPNPIIRVDQIAWVIFDKPDLDGTTRFVVDFGMTFADKTDEGTFFRGAGAFPYCYIARPSRRAAFVGTGFVANHHDDLIRLSRATGVPIEPLQRPGGGNCVRLVDPIGFVVEVAHGIAPAEPLPARVEPLPVNSPGRKTRINTAQRHPLVPAAVFRLGHCVISTPRFEETAAWYMRHLGLIPSDVECIPNGKPVLAFLRTDRGTQPSDHHALAIGTALENEYVHCAFEVVDIDAVGQGHQVLKRAGWKHAWGIGRHLLGSQIFDYWTDPDGHEHEHYADGDVYDNTVPTGYSTMDRGTLWQWGQDLPSDFLPQPRPSALPNVIRELRAGNLDLSTLKQLAAALLKKPRPWLR